VVLLLGGAAFAAGVTFYGKSLDKNITRTDPFAALTGGRPLATTNGAINMLLVGSDSRDPGSTVESANAWRADTIIVMHIPKDHKSAYLVSIPRDLYVPIPQNAGGDCGGNRNKINAAFAFGGLPLAVKTVECLTDIRMDHVAAIDFGGFKEVTDALGGVTMNVEQEITSIHKPFRHFNKGKQHMNGAEALDYVRQRKQFADGDFARVRHQQQFLKALMNKAASSGTLTNPSKLNAFLKAATKALTVDKQMKVLDMAVQFRNLDGSSLHFLTSPHLGSQDIDGQSVVVSDRENALSLYQAIGSDRVADWVKAHPSAVKK